MGTIHGRVLEQYGSSLSNGATVVLKQVRHYMSVGLYVLPFICVHII